MNRTSSITELTTTYRTTTREGSSRLAEGGCLQSKNTTKKSFNTVMLRRDYKHNDKNFCNLFFVNTRKNDAKIKITRINLERTSLRQDSTGTVAVVTAMGQRGRTV